MKKIELFAPQIDTIIESYRPENNVISLAVYLKLKDIYSAFSCIKSGTDDDIRHTWIEVERGPVEAFGDYEEFKESGEVESSKDFIQLRNEYYPEETKWYKFQTAKFRDDIYFYFNEKLLSSIKKDEPPHGNIAPVFDNFDRFIDWLFERIVIETDKLRKDPKAYNNYIQAYLPWTKRFGRIRRKDYWDILGVEAVRLDKRLGDVTIEKLKVFVKATDSEDIPLLPEMTASTFFRMCEICYDANNYFKNTREKIMPCDKYLKMADGRDAGLRNVERDSTKAFYDWYHDAERMGAHPWEICRGGNSTHISLSVSEVENEWTVQLAGSSVGRVEETVRMAVALSENRIPVKLSDAKEIVCMVTGSDFIGIVPDAILPRYCHRFFPKEDNIIDFMNLGFESEIIPEIIKKTCWYPLEEVIPE